MLRLERLGGKEVSAVIAMTYGIQAWAGEDDWKSIDIVVLISKSSISKYNQGLRLTREECNRWVLARIQTESEADSSYHFTVLGIQARPTRRAVFLNAEHRRMQAAIGLPSRLREDPRNRVVESLQRRERQASRAVVMIQHPHELPCSPVRSAPIG